MPSVSYVHNIFIITLGNNLSETFNKWNQRTFLIYVVYGKKQTSLNRGCKEIKPIFKLLAAVFSAVAKKINSRG